MIYRIQKTEADHALTQITEYTYALLYRMSEILFCRTKDLPQMDWSECLEARFFDQEKELHLFEKDGCLKAVRITEAIDRQAMQEEEADGDVFVTFESCDRLIKKYRLQERYQKLGQTLCVCEYLSYDQDGQAYVSLTRLAGIEEV